MTTPTLRYPIHGCQPIGHVTEQQADAAMSLRRQRIREYWDAPGLKDLIQLIEERTATLTTRAIEPGATPHDQGQAHALNNLLDILTQIKLSEEQPEFAQN